MLVLFETPAGYALFKVADEGKLRSVDDVAHYFDSPTTAQSMVQLKAFGKFENTAEALAAATALIDGKLSHGLKKFLKKELVRKDVKTSLVVADSKLGGLIKEKYGIPCIHDAISLELFRGIRSHLNQLISGLSEHEMHAMVLGLSHSLSRYKLKFSPDKVDTMIVQAISLLDDLDKELNTYAMRVKEWYGWHFPELGKIVTDNMAFAKVVKAIGFRTQTATTDLSSILPEELEAEVKEAANISMGTEINDEDLLNIRYLCDQVISISDYRTQLYDYLKNRMNAIAPNLTCMVGELVGARLIAHAGSLINLAKYPASTLQILGAEKALFRALKTKHDTPKYGLIYHASLIGQASTKLKGKISRVLAAKASLSSRVDALGDKDTPEVGLAARAKVEARLKQLEGRQVHSFNQKKPMNSTPKFEPRSVSKVYNASADSTISSAKKEKTPTRKSEDIRMEEQKTPKISAQEIAPQQKKSDKKKSRYYDEEEEKTPLKTPEKKEKRHLDDPEKNPTSSEKKSKKSKSEAIDTDESVKKKKKGKN